MRIAEINRKTAETDISVRLDLDGNGNYSIKTGMGFFDHMMTLFAVHSGLELYVSCVGDTEVDFHHSVEDIGIALGDAFRNAAGDRKGIIRYADKILPMDEALIMCAVDVSGRGGLYWDADIPCQKVGDFDTELIKEFFIALARQAGITLHVKCLAGENSHHIIEGIFKCSARVLAAAYAIDAKNADKIPSSKGVL